MLEVLLTGTLRDDLHAVFSELVRFLLEGTTPYKQSEMAMEVRKAISRYLSERGFGVDSSRTRVPTGATKAFDDEIERRFFRVEQANEPKPTTTHDGTPFPYEYDSDLHNLWGWGHCLRVYLETENPTNRLANMRFRPDETAQDAMIRFSVKYPLVIQQVRDCLDLTEKRFAEFQQSDTPDTRDALAEEMQWLSGRIIAAAGAIATADREANAIAGQSTSAKAADSQPMKASATTDAMQRLLRLYAGNVADERFNKAASVLTSSRTANDKLVAMDRELKIPPTTSAETLGSVLGVSKQAVMKTGWWIENRRGAKDEIIAERQDRLRERGQRLDNAAE